MFIKNIYQGNITRMHFKSLKKQFLFAYLFLIFSFHLNARRMGSFANIVLPSHVISIETGEKVVQRKNNTFFYKPRFTRLDYIL